ncbi:MAG TPA: porphobilinogen synthase, partial [Solirubrobacteraceae bacterium]
MAFPTTRMRRLRASPALRGLVRETELRADRLVLPLFVSETATAREPIDGMPGVERLPLGEVVTEA